MCGTWIALQDISADSGESVYYPGSHRAPRVYLHNLDVGKTLVAEDYVPFEAKVLPMWREIGAHYRREVYRPKKGTTAIWHGNLLHGGSVRRDETLERRPSSSTAMPKGRWHLPTRAASLIRSISR
jgi:ectoine hydroxylase-related dioxygenase (phytanoyl-CoA dioxygenase family)